jgi:SAM-dependent methyltransferase
MLAYAREQLTYNNSNKAIKVSFIQADMCAPQGFLSTELPVESIQLATILLGTLGHCLDNASAQQCFQNIAAALQPGGLLIIELPHPTDLFSGTYYYADSIKNYREQQGQVSGDNTGEDGDGALEEDEDEDVVDLDEEEEEDDDSYVKCWEIENPNNPEERVYVEWGREGDDFEVDRQILHRTVGLSLYRGEDLVSSEVEVVPQKCFTLQEVELLGRGAGLEVCGVYGELSMEVVGLLSEGAHRMVVCLKKERGEVS